VAVRQDAVHDESEDIPLPLRGKAVTRCIVDNAIGLDFIDDGKRSTIRIESSFQIRGIGADKSLCIGRVEDMGKALVLIGKTVEKALARGDGALGVTFDDGTVLSVLPDLLTEAWEFAGSDRSVVVCNPGGGLSMFVEPEPAKAKPKV